MPLFKNKSKDSKKTSKKEDVAPVHNKEVVVKTKKKIGIKRKQKKMKNQPAVFEETSETNSVEKIDTEIDFLDDEQEEAAEETTKKDFSQKKKKVLVKKEMKDKPVYLEDTGEKLGTVFDTIYDKDQNIVGFKIKDAKSETVLSFPLQQFDYSKDGLIFIPSWYTNSLKTIEKLEFKDKIAPELTALLSDDAVSNEELYDIFIKHDDDMATYIEDAIALRELLSNRLGVLERQRIALKDDLMDLTEKRLIKDIDRREFSEDVMKHRRKVNVLDLNINKCKDLIKRLDNTSFGVLGKNNQVGEETPKKLSTPLERESVYYNRDIKSDFNPKEKLSENNITKAPDIYKDKYFTLKQQFEQLEEEYQELKSAVNKMLK